MAFGEGYRKSNPELENQLNSAEQILDTPESSLVPTSVKLEGILEMSIQEIKEKYSRRYDSYVKLVREQKGSDNLSEKELIEMRRWLAALNSLDRYIQDHYQGEEQTLRPRQINAFEDLRNFLEQGGNDGYIKLPTGVGKTVLFTEFIEAVNMRTLVVVPTKLLIKQTKGAIGKFASDLDVGRIYGNAKEHGRQVTITTYDSLVSQVKEGKIKPEDYDCLILDEVHNSLSDQRAKTVARFSDSLRLGFTATPEYNPEKNVRSLLGTEIHTMNIREGVEERLLSSFSALIARTETDLSQVKTYSNTGEYSQKELEKAINVAGRNQAAVELYKKMFEGRSAVTYCVGVEHATTVANNFKKAGISAAHISGQMTEKVQQALLQKFKYGEIKVLCNADILIAGFDEPRASVCLNLRPTRSRVVAEQRGGRVLRLDENNPEKHAYIVDFLDKDGRGVSKPPVLFADVAEGAEFLHPKKRVGLDKNEGEGSETVYRGFPTLDLANLKIITDVTEIMKIVGVFREREQEIEKQRQKEFLPYTQLRKEVRQAGLESSTQYTRIYKRHPGWPASPSQIYETEWVDWDEFLERPSVLSFAQFREEVLAAEVRTSKDYKKVYKDHQGWIAQPEYLYTDEWPGWSEFLERYRTYDQLKAEVKNAGIETWPEYRKIYRDHQGWPGKPDKHYIAEWRGWDEFFEREKMLSYQEFRKEVLAAGIKTGLEYRDAYKNNPNWPSSPNLVYKSEWRGWDEFFEKPKFLPLEELKNEVLATGVITNADYRKVYRDHEGWPAAPEATYKSDWPGWPSFLSKEVVELLSIGRLKEEAFGAGIQSRSDYSKTYKVHRGWPAAPEKFYGSEWPGWTEFLGKGERRERREIGPRLPYTLLKEEVIKAGIKLSTDYRKAYKNHVGWPAVPKLLYKSEWEGWDEFLGGAEFRSKFISYQQCRAEVLQMGIKSVKEYQKVSKDHPGWPANPYDFYKKDWPGWPAFLGKK